VLTPFIAHIHTKQQKMRSTLSAVAVLASALQLVNAQTFTDCDPTKKTCPADPGLGTTITTDFTKGITPDWTLADGTTMQYDSTGAVFSISKKTDAPTISSAKYIMFGKITVEMLPSPGVGIVSSFILESDDLDEIDWEWLGGTDTSVESNFFGKGDTTTYDRAIYHPVSKAVSASHVYVIDWDKDSIKWSVDGNLVRTLSYNDPLTHGGKNYPQTPMKIKMGSWVGCVDAAAAADPKTKGTCDWAGGPADFTKTWKMSVKSVTIQDYGCGGDYTYTDLTGSYQSIKSSGKCDGKGTSGSSSSSSVASSSTVSSSASSSSASGSATTSSGSSTTTSGNILVQTSASNSTVTTGSPTGTTLTTANPTGTNSAGGAGAGASGTTSGTTPKATSAANVLKPKHSYGVLDFAVIGLGLGLGYLVM
jgi:beta-glucanase (GH16 family)